MFEFWSMAIILYRESPSLWGHSHLVNMHLCETSVIRSEPDTCVSIDIAGRIYSNPDIT